MKICKYCKKPILDNDVWNPDSEGNGYHHACLCEMEFRLRDRQIYNKGRADVLDKIRAEVENINVWGMRYNPDTDKDRKPQIVQKVKEHVIEILDNYKAETEVDNGNDD